MGRPNVGKSTLFNRLTGTRDALVADYPGLTRDRLYGYSRSGERPAVVIDTGGLAEDGDELSRLMARQVELAVAEADSVVLLVEATTGLTPGDQNIAAMLRRTGKPVILAVNKAEGLAPESVAAEFWSLGIGEPLVISAERGDRVSELLARALASCPDTGQSAPAQPAAGLRIAVVGRPNVGKSTLINRYLGEERLVTQNEAGTTRDSIYIPFVWESRSLVLVDTAGIRRRARVTEMVEKFSVVKSLRAIESADAVIVLLDGQEGISDQDVSLIGLVLERGRALTVGVNKWDGMSAESRKALRSDIERRLPFLDFVELHYVSAAHGSNVRDLMASAVAAADSAFVDMPTPAVTQALERATVSHPPPLVRGRRIKLSYAHQGGRNPPVIVIHGNQVDRLPLSYRRYLMNCFRQAFRLTGTPLRLELAKSHNPYAGKRNTLTPRQERQRKRIRTRQRR